MERKLDILLVSEDDTISNQLLNSFDRDENTITVVRFDDVSREVNRQTRDIVIIVQTSNDHIVEQVQYIKSINPLTFIIFLATDSDINLLRNMTRAGAEEFFVLPEELSLFISRFPTIQKSYQMKLDSEKEQPIMFGKGRGQIFSFYSGKGGTGKSLISSTFAQTLKLESAAEVILIDLNIQYGGIETLMSINTNRSIADLKPVIQELNENHIRNVSQKEEHSQLEILISPCDAEIGEQLDEDFISRLLRTCRRSFDYCVIDLPPQMNALTATAIEESDQICYVLLPETSSLKVLKNFEEVCKRLGIHLQSSVTLIVNELSKEKELQLKDLKNLLRFPIASTIRYDYKGLQTFINKGEVIRKKQREKLIPFAKDIRKFVKAVLHRK
ncbi:pilus assembly protein CpaE [Salinibacillus kushneri]|uniref:Pilus assembly protein CpaE n=1 Tax=Salinibacillus kushneri TaxID=237682 RepID=A0A1I0J5Q0_9BACI|nr:AAA family ATPase [Salinibacillus kushneri]SEU05149.1 pilus assembly protein CpaE [Salinibacillus kushneri]